MVRQHFRNCLIFVWSFQVKLISIKRNSSQNWGRNLGIAFHSSCRREAKSRRRIATQELESINLRQGHEMGSNKLKKRIKGNKICVGNETTWESQNRLQLFKVHILLRYTGTRQENTRGIYVMLVYSLNSQVLLFSLLQMLNLEFSRICAIIHVQSTG